MVSIFSFIYVYCINFKEIHVCRKLGARLWICSLNIQGWFTLVVKKELVLKSLSHLCVLFSGIQGVL